MEKSGKTHIVEFVLREKVRVNEEGLSALEAEDVVTKMAVEQLLNGLGCGDDCLRRKLEESLECIHWEAIGSNGSSG